MSMTTQEIDREVQAALADIHPSEAEVAPATAAGWQPLPVIHPNGLHDRLNIFMEATADGPMEVPEEAHDPKWLKASKKIFDRIDDDLADKRDEARSLEAGTSCQPRPAKPGFLMSAEDKVAMRSRGGVQLIPFDAEPTKPNAQPQPSTLGAQVRARIEDAREAVTQQLAGIGLFHAR